MIIFNSEIIQTPYCYEYFKIYIMPIFMLMVEYVNSFNWK